MTIPKITFFCNTFKNVFPFHNGGTSVHTIMTIRIIRKLLVILFGFVWPSIDDYETEYSASMIVAIIFSVIFTGNALLMMYVFSPSELTSHERSKYDILGVSKFKAINEEDSKMSLTQDEKS
jgi:hypothetical protein